MERTSIQPHHNPTILQTLVVQLKCPHIFVFTFGHCSGGTESSQEDQQNAAPVNRKDFKTKIQFSSINAHLYHYVVEHQLLKLRNKEKKNPLKTSLAKRSKRNSIKRGFKEPFSSR